MNEWQPIETAPQDGTEIVSWGEQNAWLGWSNREEQIMFPPCWQPLPDHPPFAQINSLGGYIGRLAWWNTMDTQAVNPHCPVNVRFWGKGPFLLRGWGSAK